MTQDELMELVKNEVKNSVSAVQTLAATRLQSCQGDLVQVSNAIIDAAATASAMAVLSILIRAGVIQVSDDDPKNPPADQT